MDIERIIEEILGMTEKREDEEKTEEAPPPLPKRKKGRQKVGELPIWAVGDEATSRRRTFAFISMCIKDDPEQSIEELAEKVAEFKQRPYGECLAVLRELRKKGELGYYSDEYRLIPWETGRRERRKRK